MTAPVRQVKLVLLGGALLLQSLLICCLVRFSLILLSTDGLTGKTALLIAWSQKYYATACTRAVRGNCD